MTHGSLFSGIGGFDLAAQWMGWNNVFHCEWNEFGQKVLKHYWPKSISYGDITKTDFTIHRGRIDILTGGFPCQDASIAMQHGSGQKGLEGDRTGLWTHMVRATEEIRPKYVIAENVANILRTNNGRDFQTILRELARMGYNAEWRVTRANEAGAAHNRARLYLVGYSNCIRLQKGESFFAYVGKEAVSRRRRITGTTGTVGISWPPEPVISWLDDGIPEWMGKKSFRGWRYKSIKAYGNAVVPQVVYQIFKAIQQYENL
jgi:DNA (cytosine-5)-methyltransferase 1